MNVYLVRHGDKPNISGDPGLSELGVIQSKMAGEYFRDKDIARIISSPFKRTLETAQAIARILELEFSVDERLKERLNFGDDPDLSFDQFLEEWKRTTIDRTFQPKIGDSSMATGDRVLEVIRESQKKYPDKNILI